MVPKYLSQADADRAIARARSIKEALAEERTKARLQALREVKEWIKANQKHSVAEPHEGFVYTKTLDTKLDEMIKGKLCVNSVSGKN